MDEDDTPDPIQPRSDRVDHRASGRDPEESGPFSSAPMDPGARIETTIQQAIRAGNFDNLAGAGKPLRGLGGRADPDWWIRQKIEDEKLGGLGPAALTLRSEYAGLRERLDDMYHESDVRAAVNDFNRRVIEARRQLEGGPPVVTPTCDVNAEVDDWRERSAARTRPAETRDQPHQSWRERRRTQREARRSS